MEAEQNKHEGDRNGSFLGGGDCLNKLGLKIPPLVKYHILPEESIFNDPLNPYYIDENDFLITSLLGEERAKWLESVSLHRWFQISYVLAVIFEGVGSYGITDVLPNTFAAATLIAFPFRFAALCLLNKELLWHLAKEIEFRILVFCWIFATIGLLDMFNYVSYSS